ncbi:MAG: hypothetical protein NTU93_07950 [Arthrobacter sp.]|nr:hypothetical protein [Arthrobacter sp.]
MNEILIIQIVAIVTIVLQLVKSYIPALAEMKRVLPILAVALGIIVAVVSTLPAAIVGWAWAYGAVVHGVIGGLTAAGAYDAAIQALFRALAGVKAPTLTGGDPGGPPATP